MAALNRNTLARYLGNATFPGGGSLLGYASSNCYRPSVSVTTIQRIRNPPKAQMFGFAAPRLGIGPTIIQKDSQLTKNLVLSSAVLALAGEYAMNIIGFLRQVFPESVGLVTAAAICYLPYNAPSFIGDAIY